MPERETRKKEINLTGIENTNDFVEKNHELIKERIAKMSPQELSKFLCSIAIYGFDQSMEGFNAEYMRKDKNMDFNEGTHLSKKICSELGIDCDSKEK